MVYERRLEENLFVMHILLERSLSTVSSSVILQFVFCAHKEEREVRVIKDSS